MDQQHCNGKEFGGCRKLKAVQPAYAQQVFLTCISGLGCKASMSLTALYKFRVSFSSRSFRTSISLCVSTFLQNRRDGNYGLGRSFVLPLSRLINAMPMRGRVVLSKG